MSEINPGEQFFEFLEFLQRGKARHAMGRLNNIVGYLRKRRPAIVDSGRMKPSEYDRLAANFADISQPAIARKEFASIIAFIEPRRTILMEFLKSIHEDKQ